MNNYQKIVEKDFIYYNIIAIKWGESTHFPGRIDPSEQVIGAKRPGFVKWGGLDYYFLLFIVPLNPFGIKFMSKNRFNCVCFISRFVNKLPLMLPRTRF